MRLRPTEDEAAVQELFAGFFANESPPPVVRDAEPLGYSADLWEKLCATGAPGMALDEAVGGGGATLVDLAGVAYEAGRRLAPVPIVEHAAATRLLARSGQLTPELVAGDEIATLAVRPATNWVFRLAPAGAVANHVVGMADDQVVLVSTAPPSTAPRTTSDTPLADRPTTDAAPLTEVTVADWRRSVSEWQALTAVALTGLGTEAVTIGVEYVKERQQFGVPVGSFQAVQHGLADAAVRLQGSLFLAHKAVWALEHNPEDAERLAAMAFLFASETAQAATASSLQYHGGYGYAEEYDIQLYYRRARGWALAYGSLGREYQRLADITLGTKGAA